MPHVDEGPFRYHFPDQWNAVKFDNLTFYRSHFQSVAGGIKAVDVVAVEPRSNALWLIEAKDYRGHAREKLTSLEQELALKAVGTLACLMAGRANAGDTGDRNADSIWANAVKQRSIRFVFHLEQPQRTSTLFPQSVDPKMIKDILKRATRSIDNHPFGGDFASINHKGFGWQVIPNP